MCMTTFPHVTHVPTTTASNQRVAGVASASGVSSLGLTAIVTNMSLLPPGQDVHSILTIPKQTQSPEGGDVGEGAEPSKELEGSRGIVYLKSIEKVTRSNSLVTYMLLPMFISETHPENSRNIG